MFKLLRDIVSNRHSKNHYKNIECAAGPGSGRLKTEIPLPEYSCSNPYPRHYEKKAVTRTGLEVHIRPIKPEDETLLLDLFDALSPETRYYRFFSPLRVLPREMLIKFTHIDYSRDMALVAVDSTDQGEKLLAVARFMSRSGKPDTEFAVVVRDEWQGRGIGRVLLENLIMIARERKIESMSGYVMSENTHMLSLARHLGFSLARVPGENQYFVEMNLESMNNKQLPISNDQLHP